LVKKRFKSINRTKEVQQRGGSIIVQQNMFNGQWILTVNFLLMSKM